ncbi:MAG: hypothetical protein TEF_08625 [Rhizobiales bacterium NRL2]|jgi:predicted TIM-barrel fold metal-dependent hydrolase|nr:MAG: hypothetical protein TEF_08625 [Rhizobiales bacterium NRL2]
MVEIKLEGKLGNESGHVRDTRKPKLRTFPGACDCHMHIVGPFDRYPLGENRALTPLEGLYGDYVRMIETIGVRRVVIVQPSFYGTDNSCTLESTERLGANGRAVVAIHGDIPEADVAAMHQRGARGVRINPSVKGGLTLAQFAPVAQRIKQYGWHIQFFIDARTLPDLVDSVVSLDIPVVFDHMARIQADSGTDEEGFKMLLELMRDGRAWVKLSTALHEPDDALAERAHRLIDANPDRCVWGTDWPHSGFPGQAPNDGDLFDLLGVWARDDATRRKILVDNPTALYFAH